MPLHAVRSTKLPTAGRRSVVYRDSTGKTWEGKVLGASTVVSASGASRTTNVVTATVPTGHGLTVGKVVTVDFADNTYDGTFTITAVTATTVQWSQTAADDPSAGTGTIQVVNGLKLELVSQRSPRADRIRDHVDKATSVKDTDAYFRHWGPDLTLA